MHKSDVRVSCTNGGNGKARHVTFIIRLQAKLWMFLSSVLRVLSTEILIVLPFWEGSTRTRGDLCKGWVQTYHRANAWMAFDL